MPNYTYYALKLTPEQARIVHDSLVEIKRTKNLLQGDSDRLGSVINRLGKELSDSRKRINLSEKGTHHLI